MLLILSVAAWYILANFGFGKAIIPYLEEQVAAQTDTSTAVNSDSDSIFPDMPEAPVVPDHDHDDFSFDSVHTVSVPSVEEDFDIQAHLQLMRQNVSKYNYTLAYKHGARIASYLLAKPIYVAEWGQILLESGRPNEAVNVLQRIVEEDTVKSDVTINMAFAMLRSKNADAAVEFLDKQMINNKDVDLLVAKAAIISEHPEVKKRVDAERIFARYANNSIISPRADYWYGRFLMQRGDFQKSKMYLERAIKEKPNEPRYIARLGMAEFFLKQDSKAEALYKQALKINPYDYNTWFNLGELYLSLANESSNVQNIRQKTHQAMSSYKQVLENDPMHAMANYRIGLILNGNGQYKEAIPHLNIALEKMPQEIPVMQQLSAAYISLGDTTRSVGYLENILQIDPFNRIAASEFNRIRGRR